MQDTHIARGRRQLAIAAIFTLIGAACGTGASGPQPAGESTAVPPSAPSTTESVDPTTMATAAPTSEAPDAEPEPESAEASTVGEEGSFAVNGEAFAVTLLNRCIPFQDDEGNIDLQALAQGSSVKLNLYLTGGVVEVSVDGSGLREKHGSIAFGDDAQVHASAVAGDRWTGSATVGDSLDTVDPVDITWDVMVPAEAQDCSF